MYHEENSYVSSSKIKIFEFSAHREKYSPYIFSSIRENYRKSKFLNFHISWNFFLCATIIIQKKDYRKFKFLNFPYIVKKIRLTFPSLASWKIFVLFPPLCTWKLSRIEIFEFSIYREKNSPYVSFSSIMKNIRLISSSMHVKTI